MQNAAKIVEIESLLAELIPGLSIDITESGTHIFHMNDETIATFATLREMQSIPWLNEVLLAISRMRAHHKVKQETLITEPTR